MIRLTDGYEPETMRQAVTLHPRTDAYECSRLQPLGVKWAGADEEVLHITASSDGCVMQEMGIEVDQGIGEPATRLGVFDIKDANIDAMISA